MQPIRIVFVLFALLFAAPASAYAGGGHALGWTVHCSSPATKNLIIEVHKLYNMDALTHYEVRVAATSGAFAFFEKLVPKTSPRAKVRTANGIFTYTDDTAGKKTLLRLSLRDGSGRIAIERSVPQTLSRAQRVMIRLEQLTCKRN